MIVLGGGNMSTGMMTATTTKGESTTA